MLYFLLYIILTVGQCYITKPNRMVIVTGGTRGIGKGISEAMAENGNDLLLSYMSNKGRAEECKKYLSSKYNIKVETISGDISTKETRDKIFKLYDNKYKNTHELKAVIHNAGQYVGLTALNENNLSKNYYNFGDGSLLKVKNSNKEEEREVYFEQMKYYQRLYGDAYIDLCERGLERMKNTGSLIGISSPGCNINYRPPVGYDMPGTGKCIMEFTMRLFAIRAAPRGINCNVIIPGATDTDALNKMIEEYGEDKKKGLEFIKSRIPMNNLLKPEEIGKVVNFLCSENGKKITGISLPVDGGSHLNS